jgi:hypothetical protein
VVRHGYTEGIVVVQIVNECSAEKFIKLRRLEAEREQRETEIFSGIFFIL